jgi:photosystem II stability/assembly factor-like uncharacterized protein
MVNFDVTALEDCDLYRLHIAERTGITANVFEIQCVDLCHGERCVNCGNPETDAVLVAGGIDDGGGASPWILINEDGGAVDSWTGIDITEWDTFNVDGITCLGTWGAAVSNGAAAALYSRDRFTTRVTITSTDMTANPPWCIDASSQNFAVIGGDNGYIFISRDGLATVETALAGTVTTEDITEIAIAPSNALVVYAASYADDVILKTENGGDTWFQVALTGTAHGIFSLCIHPDDANMVLVGTDDGEIFQTTDGGETWVEQAEVPGLVTPAATVIRDIDTVGCGVWFAAISDNAAVFRVYVNYEDGASGAWEYFNPLDGETYDLTLEPLAVAAVSANRCVAVGGDNATADLVALLA